jgi:uncharacterized protein YjbI with pentapeptide repeats
LTWEQFLSTKNGKAKDFSKISVQSATVKGWDFSNATLKEWGGCDFPDCNFDNATIDVPNFCPLVKHRSKEAEEPLKKGLTREQFESTANYRSKNLRGIRFGWSDLCGIDFSGFYLTDAEFYETNLADVRFDDAVIRGCHFTVFEGSKNASLTKEQFYSTATYKSGIVGGIWFHNMDLSDWDFSKVKLLKCAFYGCTGEP